jgi:hypothetical protein
MCDFNDDVGRPVIYKFINYDFSITILTLVKVTFEPVANEVRQGYFTYENPTSLGHI